MSDGPMRFTQHLVVGLAITIVGLTLLLDRFGLVHAWTVFQFWPVIVILFGASVVAQALRGSPGPQDAASGYRAERRIVAGPLILFLVILGIASTARNQRPWNTTDTTSDYVNLHTVMGGNRHTSHSDQFKGGQMTIIMGGTRLDLRQATIAPGTEAVIDVEVVMGGVELFVPTEWTVDVQLLPILGGVEDRRVGVPNRRRDRRRDRAAFNDDRPGPSPSSASDRNGTATAAPGGPAPAVADNQPGPEKNPMPRLIVRGFIMMGGLNIKS